MKLKNLNEIIGTLHAVNSKGWSRILVFNICQEIEIPFDAIPDEQLQGLIGRRIGLFNNSGDYRIREIKINDGGKII